MLERLLTILSEYVVLDPNEITLQSELRKDLGLNSLEFIHLVTVIEREFKVEISEREAINFQYVGDVIAYLEKETALR
ncbi:MAG TPA: phosphopantetheine-binding protein [Oscillospiraceae bacterium]|nr:phosphopantetheine-binding protein [Oscillospiraceae bacterium]HPS36001.1 phosphopantetheine-binding protein [Oscillospiraceae bacterium]